MFYLCPCPPPPRPPVSISATDVNRKPCTSTLHLTPANSTREGLFFFWSAPKSMMMPMKWHAPCQQVAVLVGAGWTMCGQWEGNMYNRVCSQLPVLPAPSPHCISPCHWFCWGKTLVICITQGLLSASLFRTRGLGLQRRCGPCRSLPLLTLGRLCGTTPIHAPRSPRTVPCQIAAMRSQASADYQQN